MMAKHVFKDLSDKGVVNHVHTQTASNGIGIKRAKYLSSMLKNDLGEILKRSLCVRKWTPKSSFEFSSFDCKSVPKLPKKNLQRSKSLSDLSVIKKGVKSKKKLALEAMNLERQNSDSLGERIRGGGNIYNLRRLSKSTTNLAGNIYDVRRWSSSTTNISASSNIALSPKDNVDVFKKIKPLTSSKKRKYKGKAHSKAKSDLDQSDDDVEINKSFVLEELIPSESETRTLIKDSDLEKTMPILTVSNNFGILNATDKVEVPVFEIQTHKSPIRNRKSLRKGAKKLDMDLEFPGLCTCQTHDGNRQISSLTSESYCEGVDCIDGRLSGCVKKISSVVVFRSSVRTPFQALCEFHRQQMRSHRSCSHCGQFCIQGTFIQCLADSKKIVHLAHKNCLLEMNGVEVCPHCHQSSHLQTVHIEQYAPKSANFFQTQQLPFNNDLGTRGMAFKENVMADNALLSSKSCKISDICKEISVGLPAEPKRCCLGNTANSFLVSKWSTENLFNAAKDGDIEKVIQMFILGFDVNTKFHSSDNQTILHLAAGNGYLTLVYILVQAGAAVDAIDNNLMTPIMLAIENGHATVIQYLIQAGVQLGAGGKNAMTALHLAAKYGPLNVVKNMLHTNRVDVNVQDDGGWTPLIWACEFNHTTIVELFLDNEANFNLRDKEQNVALHWCAFSGNLEISELLLDYGCDVNTRNVYGDTPLHVAARQDKYECVILFLDRNANIDIVNKMRETPIMCCDDHIPKFGWL